MTVDTKLTSAQLAPIHTELAAIASDVLRLPEEFTAKIRHNLRGAIALLSPGITLDCLARVRMFIVATADMLNTLTEAGYIRAWDLRCRATNAAGMCLDLLHGHAGCDGDPYDCNDYGDDTEGTDNADSTEGTDNADSTEDTAWLYSPVNEIYIDFDEGKITGICDGCDAADVAVALERIARELRLMDSTPSYIDFDEGKISASQREHTDANA